MEQPVVLDLKAKFIFCKLSKHRGDTRLGRMLRTRCKEKNMLNFKKLLLEMFPNCKHLKQNIIETAKTCI